MIARNPSLLPNFCSRVSVSTCFVKDASGSLLLLRRSRSEDQPSTWCVPGGKIEQGESAKDAILREVREETGISLPPPSVNLRTTRYVRIPNWDYQMHVFEARITDVPEIKLDPMEHDAFTWRQPDHIDDLPLIKGQKEMVGVIYGAKEDDDIVAIED